MLLAWISLGSCLAAILAAPTEAPCGDLNFIEQAQIDSTGKYVHPGQIIIANGVYRFQCPSDTAFAYFNKGLRYNDWFLDCEQTTWKVKDAVKKSDSYKYYSIGCISDVPYSICNRTAKFLTVKTAAVLCPDESVDISEDANIILGEPVKLGDTFHYTGIYESKDEEIRMNLFDEGQVGRLNIHLRFVRDRYELKQVLNGVFQDYETITDLFDKGGTLDVKVRLTEGGFEFFIYGKREYLLKNLFDFLNVNGVNMRGKYTNGKVRWGRKT